MWSEMRNPWNSVDNISDSCAKEFKPKVPNDAKCNNKDPKSAVFTATHFHAHDQKALV